MTVSPSSAVLILADAGIEARSKRMSARLLLAVPPRRTSISPLKPVLVVCVAADKPASAVGSKLTVCSVQPLPPPEPPLPALPPLPAVPPAAVVPPLAPPVFVVPPLFAPPLPALPPLPVLPAVPPVTPPVPTVPELPP